MDGRDRLSISKSKTITDQFEVGERILLSSKIIKVNQVNKKQERVLLITNKAVYNLLPQEENPVLGFFIEKIIPQQRIKRKIPIITIYGLTYSNIGTEFVIHVPTEYDYRYQATEDRKEIVETLLNAFVRVNQKKMPIFFKDDFTLVTYTTTENDLKKGISRMPTTPPELFDGSEFIARVSNKIQSEVVFSRPSMKSNKISIDDFDLIKVLGRGAFGKVMLCEKKDTKELFAIKSLRKDHIMDKNQVEHTRTERKLLEQINNPFLVSLDYAFQTDEKLFFVMKFMRGGELFHHLRKARRFNEGTAMFYAASIIYALEYLHKLNCVYRDLKPENILMGEDGYVQVTDFGLAKFIDTSLTYSFVGTPEYLAPEIIKQQGHSYPVDWWSLGILIYEMIVGRPPFYSQNQHQLFKMIVENEVLFPSQIQVSPDAKSLIQALLKKNPYERLGHKNDGEDIRQHAWFKNAGFNFADLQNKRMLAPIVPKIADKFDVNNFDDEFTSEEPINSVVTSDKGLLQQFNNDFGDGVTYVGKKLGE